MKKLAVVCLLSIFPSLCPAESLDVVSDGVIVNNYSGLTPKSTIHIYDATEAGVAMQTNDQGGTAGTGKIRVDHSPNSPSGGYSGQVVIEPYGYNDSTSTYEFFEDMLVVDENGVGLGTGDPELNLHIYDVNADEDDQAGVLLKTESGTSDVASGRVVVRHSDTYAESDRGQIIIEPKDSVGFVENAFVVDPLGVGIGIGDPEANFHTYNYTGGSYVHSAIIESNSSSILALRGTRSIIASEDTSGVARFLVGHRLFEDHLTIENKETDGSIVFRTVGSGAVVLNYTSGSSTTDLCIDQYEKVYRCTSSAKYKTDIQELTSDKASAKLAKLHPVTYKRIDGSNGDFLEVGLIAEDVAKELPELASYDEDGAPLGVHYKSVAVVAVAALQEQVRLNEEQQSAIAIQNKKISELEEKLEQSLKKVALIEEGIRSLERNSVGVSYRVN